MSHDTTPESRPAYAPAADVSPAPPTPGAAHRHETAVRPDRRPFVLRARGRATMVVVGLGVPLLAALAVAQVLPGALWFDELGQADVFRRTLAARAELYALLGGAVALFVGANLALGLSRTGAARTRAWAGAVAAAA